MTAKEKCDAVAMEIVSDILGPLNCEPENKCYTDCMDGRREEAAIDTAITAQGKDGK